MGGYEKFITTQSFPPPNMIAKYEVKNNRNICNNYTNKDVCNTNLHCHWTHNGCNFALTVELIVKFVSKVSEELAENSLKTYEILQYDNYFVSDIVNYDNYTERPGQKIIKTDNKKLKKILGDLFGSDNIPIIGKFRNDMRQHNNPKILNDNNKPLDYDNMLIQNIIPENLTLLRAYVNGYYWIKNKLKDNEFRNLGYYNTIQADFANYFRGSIIDWLLDQKNKDDIDGLNKKTKNELKSKDYAIFISKNQNQLTNGFVELYILNKLNQIPIIVTNTDDKLIYLFDITNNILYHDDNSENIDFNQYINNKKDVIHIRYDNIISGLIPEKIEVVLYK